MQQKAEILDILKGMVSKKAQVGCDQIFSQHSLSLENFLKIGLAQSHKDRGIFKPKVT